MTLHESLATLREDRRNVAAVDIVITFAVLAGIVWVLVRYPGPWTYVLAYGGIGLMQYRIAIACHEAVHKTLLFPLWLNEAAGAFHCALVGLSLLKYRRQHMEHHAAQTLQQDTDAYIYEPILETPAGVRRIAVLIFGTAEEVWQKAGKKGLTASSALVPGIEARIHAFGIAAVQGALLVSCAIWLSWWHYFALWLLPLLTIAVFLNRVRVLVEHGYAHVPRVEGSALSAASVLSIDVSANLLERFFIAPFRFNYHATHHRVPSIPSYRIPDLSSLLERHGIVKPGAARPSYTQALRHVLWN